MDGKHWNQIEKRGAGMHLEVSVPSPQNEEISIVQLVQLAQSGSLDVDKLERIIALKERVDAQSRKEAFDRALIKCQAEIPRVKKNGLVETRDGKPIYSYARLEDIDASIRPIYQRHGFTVTFDAPMAEDGKIRVVGRFCCAGHTQALEFTASASNRGAGGVTLTDAQKAKQTITECRRHLLEMFFNIITEGADNPPASKVISEEQARTLQCKIDEVGADSGKLLKYFDAKTLSDLNEDQHDAAMRMLEQRRTAGKK